MAASRAHEVCSLKGGFTEDSLAIDYDMDCLQQRMASTTLKTFSSHVFYVANTGFFIQLRKDTIFINDFVSEDVFNQLR